MISGAASMGIKPAEFWRLTPHELALYARGQTDKRHSDLETLAWMQANLINIHIAKGPKLTAEKLYRRPHDERREFASSDEFLAYMREREA